MYEAPRTILFDHEGALEVARRLVHLADRLEAALGRRASVLDAALASWTGPRRDEVADRVPLDAAAAAEAAGALRAEADRWARAWAVAADDVRREAWHRAMAATSPVAEVALPVPPPVGIPFGPRYEPTAVLGGHGGGGLR